jgi:integrase
MAAPRIKSLPKLEFKEKIHPFNQMLMNEFLDQQQLSDQTLKQYASSLSIFFSWVYETCQNKPLYELKPRDALRFQNYLMSAGLSSNGVKFKRSSVSSLCGYLEVYYGDDYPLFRNIYSKSVANPPKEFVKEKRPIPLEDFERLIATLREQDELQMVAYLLTSYYTGARRSEVAQFKRSFLELPKIKDKEYYMTPEIRGKGKGKNGKRIKLVYDDVVRDAILAWLEKRGDDEVDEVFVRKYKDGRVEPLNPATFNSWFTEKFNSILGDFAYAPHSLRRSRATHMVVNFNMDISKVKSLLNHESSETSQTYVIKDTDDELDDIF